MTQIITGIIVLIAGLVIALCGISLTWPLLHSNDGKFLKVGNFKVIAAEYKEDPDRLWVEVATKFARTGISFNHDMTSAYMPLTKSLIEDGRTVGFTANGVISGDWKLQGKVHLLKWFKKNHPEDGRIYRLSFIFENGDRVWDRFEDVPVKIEVGTPSSLGMQWEDPCPNTKEDE
jgi:hypothetical protein